MNEYETVSKSVKTDIIEGLKDSLPQIFEDEKINLEKLKALLTAEIVEKEDDRFYFNWAGKSKLFKLIQEPGYGTLKPDKKRSIDFDNTENIVIVGENLETLKLLLKPYFGKVKMIYIDPPYNTGNDFIYRDNFKEPLKDYLEKTGQIDSEGSKLTTNTEASGRYHSDWLNFMYPRLFLARSLLRDNGVIFVSIDDNEVHHLRMIMDEIMGEENFIGILKWKRKKQPSFLHGHIAGIIEYILVYGKNEKNVEKLSIEKRSDFNTRVDNADNKLSTRRITAGIRIKLPPDVKLVKKGKYENKSMITEYLNDTRIANGRTLDSVEIKAQFRNTQEAIDSFIKKDLLFITKNYGLRRDLSEEEKEKRKMIKDLLLDWGDNQEATEELNRIFQGKKVYDYPKPIRLIKNIVKSLFTEDEIILDFFAGSGTTGHVVWELNMEDSGNRKFILVNLDEEVQDGEIKKDFPTVADICIERLKRVSEKYNEEEQQKLTENDQDFGFKVFRLDKSNFNLKDEFEISEDEDREELKRKYLDWLGLWINEPLVGDWKPIDIVYEIMLKEGFDLNSKIEQMRIKENKFFHVADEKQELEFYMSLDEKISDDAIEEIRTSEYGDKVFVFLDKALTDNDKINLSAFVRLKVI